VIGARATSWFDGLTMRKNNALILSLSKDGVLCRDIQLDCFAFGSQEKGRHREERSDVAIQ
jgi:hypothetical protein